MPDITCEQAALDPVVYAIDNGNIVVQIYWSWDGVSVAPNCDGPLTSVRLINNSSFTYYCNLPAKKKGLRNFEIPPNTNMVYTAQQLKTAGLDNYSDTIGVQPHRSPLNLM